MADCFLKVRAHTESNPVFIKSNLLLRALDDTVPSKSPAIYYAAILDLVQTPEDQVHQEASVLLLACILQAIPVALIQKEFSLIKSSVIGYVHKDSPFLAKYSIKVLERLVQVITKEEWEAWGEKIKTFVTLADLVLDNNEVARKQAGSSLGKLLRKGLISVPKVKNYLMKSYLEMIEMQNRHVKAETLVNCLSFLAVFLQLVELFEVYQLTDKMIGLCMNPMSSQLTTKALLVLETLFAGLKLPRDVISSYLTNLLSAPVLAGGHEELQVAYIQCLTQGLTYYNKADSAECYKMLAQGISTISEFLLSGQYNVQHAACSALKAVMIRCIKPSHAAELDPAQELLLSFDVLNIDDLGVKPIQKINAIMVYLLNDRFADILKLIFPVIAVYCQQLGSNSVHIVQRLILELDGIALKWYDNEKFKRLMASIVNTIGCDAFFNILPLRPHCVPIESQNFLEHSRSWLLQVIQADLEAGDISYFFREFIPISEELEKIQNEYLTQNLVTSSQKYSILINQIWSCFPSFCTIKSWTTSQQQLLQSKLPHLFKQMAKSPSIKSSIIIGLEKCLKPVNISLFTQVEDKIIPTLFNNYLSSPDKPILSFLKNFPISGPYADKMCKRLIQKILEARQGNKGAEGQLLMDLLIRISSKLQQLEANDKDVLSRFILAYIASPDGKEQKKAYRVLKSLAKIDRELVESLMFSGEIKFCNEVARKERLKVYHELMMSYQAELLLPMVNKYLIEVMHCLKGQSRKTRDLCKFSLAALSDKLFDHGLFMNLYNSVLAGMASEIDNTKSASLEILKILIKHLAFGQPRSMFTSIDEQDSGVFNLATVVTIMLRDNSKEVVRSALKFLKGILQVISTNSAGNLCESIIGGVFAKNNELVGNLKNLIKYLIEKLVRKCGLDLVAKTFPQEHLKLLHYVAKESKRKTKKKEKKEKDSDDDMKIDEDKVGNIREKVEKVESEPREYHFLNPLDLPATQKRKKIVKVQDYKVQGEKFVFNEDDDGEKSSDSDKPKKKRKVDEQKAKIAKKDKKKKPFAFVQYTPDILNKRKAEKAAGKLNRVVDKAKLGVLKGLKARKKKFS